MRVINSKQLDLSHGYVMESVLVITVYEAVCALIVASALSFNAPSLKLYISCDSI